LHLIVSVSGANLNELGLDSLMQPRKQGRREVPFRNGFSLTSTAKQQGFHVSSERPEPLT
jgi:hypothetical protein